MNIEQAAMRPIVVIDGLIIFVNLLSFPSLLLAASVQMLNEGPRIPFPISFSIEPTQSISNSCGGGQQLFSPMFSQPVLNNNVILQHISSALDLLPVS